jgi:hypothetical protein
MDARHSAALILLRIVTVVPVAVNRRELYKAADAACVHWLVVNDPAAGGVRERSLPDKVGPPSPVSRWLVFSGLP